MNKLVVKVMIVQQKLEKHSTVTTNGLCNGPYYLWCPLQLEFPLISYQIQGIQDFYNPRISSLIFDYRNAVRKAIFLELRNNSVKTCMAELVDELAKQADKLG